MTISQDIGLKIPNILIPEKSIDLHKWAVIACDQFTSEPEYWEQVKEKVGDAPSTFHMILPEVYLNTKEEQKRLTSTRENMTAYLNEGIFESIDDFIYLKRTCSGHTRSGLMVALDLEQYDFNKGSQTLIRATEGTIIERLPPRIRIREKAPLECPHILVLFDDPTNTVFGPLDEHLTHLEQAYDVNLMMGSGHLTGFALKNPTLQEGVMKALKALVEPEVFAEKYNLKPDHYHPLLFAMGDGNHSLATAKSIWEKLKPSVGPDHPARYALVEIENIHDPALTFEPIHRLLFDLKEDLTESMQAYWGNQLTITPFNDVERLFAVVDAASTPRHQIGMIAGDNLYLVDVKDPKDNLPVGTLQHFLDTVLDQGGAGRIDYIHGTEVLVEKAQEKQNAGFYVPGMDKSDLFKTVILDGALPRKTFSMGEAKEKRFYMECRQIQ